MQLACVSEACNLLHAPLQVAAQAAALTSISADATDEASLRAEFETAKFKASELELPVQQGPKDAWLLGDIRPAAAGLEDCLTTITRLLASRYSVSEHQPPLLRGIIRAAATFMQSVAGMQFLHLARLALPSIECSDCTCRHAYDIKEEALALDAKLQSGRELLEMWVLSQSRNTLLSALLRLPDVAKLMPGQIKSFATLERRCRGRLRDVRLQPQLLTVAANAGTLTACSNKVHAAFGVTARHRRSFSKHLRLLPCTTGYTRFGESVCVLEHHVSAYLTQTV